MRQHETRSGKSCGSSTASLNLHRHLYPRPRPHLTRHAPIATSMLSLTLTRTETEHINGNALYSLDRGFISLLRKEIAKRFYSWAFDVLIGHWLFRSHPGRIRESACVACAYAHAATNSQTHAHAHAHAHAATNSQTARCRPSRQPRCLVSLDPTLTLFQASRLTCFLSPPSSAIAPAVSSCRA